MPGIAAYHFLISIICCLSLLPTCINAQHKADKSTVLYGIFNNDSTFETRIVPIYGADMNGGLRESFKEFRIPPDSTGNNSSLWYGSATLAADQASGLFFYASKTLESQSFWAVTPQGKRIKLSQGKNQLDGHCFTKMAMGPDGYVYALSTSLRGSRSNGSTETLLIRFKACNTPGCSRVEMLGFLPTGKQYRNSNTYSGDIAFSLNGDLYIFGTSIETLVNYYTGSMIYRIPGGELNKPYSKGRALEIEYIGRMKGMGHEMGMDSVIITGAAFEPGGDFILSTMDKYSQSKIEFYRGKIMGDITQVYPVSLNFTTPKGFVISDLASVYRPPVKRSDRIPQNGEINNAASSNPPLESFIKLTTFYAEK